MINSSIIIFTTTFRPFSNSKNDEIQLEFIRSLKRQTSNKWILLTTQFLDETIDDEIDLLLANKLIHFKKNIKYNHNDVVLNAIDFVDNNIEYQDFFIVWTNSDLIYPEDFVEKLLLILEETGSFIMYPNIHKKSLISIKTYATNFLNDGIDCIGFSSKTNLREIQRLLNLYRTSGYGYFEYLLASILYIHSSTSINIRGRFEIPIKIENQKQRKHSHNKKSQQIQAIINKKILLKYLKMNDLKGYFVYPNMIGYLFSDKKFLSFIFATLKTLRNLIYIYIFIVVSKLIPNSYKNFLIQFFLKVSEFRDKLL